MPDSNDLNALLRRLDIVERNAADLARVATELTAKIGAVNSIVDELRLDRAARQERDKALNERLERIEESIEDVQKIGRWVLMAFGTSLVALIVNFVVRGGLVLQ